jgi:dGTPase
MKVREQTEAFEDERLSEFACRAAGTRGRQRPEPPCDIRTEFQRDRDRIIHGCKAFRRLAYKTQCFIGVGQDHIRTRLTHTLEVCQIARTVARALRLNEDLTEAIALGHDLGHTPFGHAGEAALDQALRSIDPSMRFRHYEQSLRVVDHIEKDGHGVNLTYETRNGIRHHSKGEKDIPSRMDNDELLTMEGRIIKWADRVAYVNHDLEDAARAGVIRLADVPSLVLDRLGRSHSERINALVADVIRESTDKPFLAMGEPTCAVLNELKDFLFEHVYLGVKKVGTQERRAHAVVRGLFYHYVDNPGGADFLSEAQRDLPLGERAQAVADYIAGMTDRFACDHYAHLFLPDGFV